MIDDKGTQPKALRGDPSRNASPSIRGIVYQFWKTVETWIDIGPDDTLYVEGAEDIDKVTQTAATGMQVKNKKAALTLATPDAIEAICNFWKLRENNKERNVSYRYITTSKVGREKTGFANEAGIESWNICRISDVHSVPGHIEEIRKFLLGRNLGASLTAFLRKASAEEIQRTLIQPFEWIHDQPGLEALRFSIISRLHEKGGKSGLSPREADKLAIDLYAAVQERAATKNPQPLTYWEIESRIGHANYVEVPRPQLEALQSALLTKFAAASGQGDTVPDIAFESEILTAPSIPPGVLARKEVHRSINACLESGVLVLHGGSGTGKTIAIRQAIPGEVIWVSLRDKPDLEILRLIRTASRSVNAAALAPTVVLDDLNPENPRILEIEIGRFQEALRSKSGRVAITSYSPLPSRLSTILGLNKKQQILIPVFSRQEIFQLLEDYGCPQVNIELLAHSVWLQTSGHPQLVIARTLALKENNFPATTIDPAEQPKEIVDIRSEVLNTLQSTESISARDLIYRLSLVMGHFSRKQALNIANIQIAIERGGEAFQRLIGPWIESISKDRFSASPLIQRIGEQVLSAEEIKRLHGEIASAFISDSPLYVSDFGSALIHAIKSQDEAVIVTLGTMFLTANSKIKRYLAEEAFWIVSIRSQIIKDQSRLAFFRLFQFEVATLTAPDDINEIFLLIESEKIKEVKSLSDAYPRIVYLTRWLANSDIDVKVSKIISAVSELWALSNWVGGQDQGLSIGADIPPMFPGVKRPFFQDLFSAAVIPRINSIEALRDFMDGLDNASEKDRSMLLDGFKTADGELRMVFNGPIISIKTSKQDQEQYANLLNEAIQKGRKWQHLFWIQAAMRARSVVLDEGLDRRKEAEKLIDAAIEEFGETNSLLDQRAIIYFNHKNYEKCLDIWRGILKRWDIDRAQKDLQPVFSSRCAAIAAARLGYLDEAAELFLSALERSQQFGRAVLTIGLQADYGYSLWKAGQKTKGANVIVEAFEALSSLPDRPNSYDEFAVRKLVSHIVMYLGSSDSILVEPQPGMCSNTAWDKTLLTLPRTPEDYCWMSIHSLAFRIGDRLLAEKASRICRFAKYAFVRFSTALLDLQETLISGPLEDAIKLGSLCAIEREKSEARPTSVTEVDPPGLTGSLTERTHTAFIQPAIICSLIRARATGSNVEKLIASWASSEEAAPVLIQKELSLVNELIACTVEELESIVTNNSSPTQRRAVASALLLGRTDTTPYGVAYAEVLLFSYATDNKLLHIAAEEAFSASIKKEWARFIEMPFRLRNPAVYVDAIREAIQTPHASWSYSARILLTALPTTTIKLSDSILSEMQAYHKEKKH